MAKLLLALLTALICVWVLLFEVSGENTMMALALALLILAVAVAVS